ncbi:MAG: cation:proton antiporter subunit C [Clostridiales bacterium]|nr:cation:proton antiporter subunit C [Clostridiales bacterium]MBS5877297.1 cation:proton antiporter subunit C [Clostridiales bacterium]MDU0939139.1 cation:proton antiporter subunit C [Clostridiales bacterium]MDU1042216.1 cation:proton antiporter subunit C [Clostridiales bacterium]MDU3490665.1 cation:proton antiporter subunit C [Clostridiales bacterium]
MWDYLINHYFEIASMILFGIGFMTLLLHHNLIKKIVGLNIIDTAIYLFIAQRGYILGRIAPVMGDSRVAEMETYINPIPAGLVLTGIVVSVSSTAFLLALTQKLYKKYNTLNLDEILLKYREEKKNA